MSAVIDSLVENGVKPADVKQIDLHGKPGSCVMTFSCLAARDAFVSSGYKVSGKEVPVILDDGGEVTSIHVFGCPLELSDGAISAAIAKYGKIIGAINRGKIDHRGFEIETGTRYVNVVLKTAIPSNIQVGNRKLRVWHKGQVRTCWRCQSAGHMAKDCPNASDQKLKQSKSEVGSRSDSEFAGRAPATPMPDLGNTTRGRAASQTSSTEALPALSPHSNWADDPPVVVDKTHAPETAADPAGTLIQDVLEKTNQLQKPLDEHETSMATPTVPSRGKTLHSSPDSPEVRVDGDGFQQATGKKVRRYYSRDGSARIGRPSVQTGSRFAALPEDGGDSQSEQNVDIQVQWAKEQAMAERRKLSERVKAREQGLQVRRGSF